MPAPCATVLVHTDVPPSPFALESTQTSLYMLLPRPPNTIIRLLAASYTAVWIERGGGEPPAPCATVLVHTDVPPSPFALDSTHAAVVDTPPNTIVLLLEASH